MHFKFNFLEIKFFVQNCFRMLHCNNNCNKNYQRMYYFMYYFTMMHIYLPLYKISNGPSEK